MCYKTAKFKHHKLTWDPSTFNALSSAVFTLNTTPVFYPYNATTAM